MQQINAIPRRILCQKDNFGNCRRTHLVNIIDNLRNRTRTLLSSNFWNDTKRAWIVTSFSDFTILIPKMRIGKSPGIGYKRKTIKQHARIPTRNIIQIDLFHIFPRQEKHLAWLQETFPLLIVIVLFLEQRLIHRPSRRLKILSTTPHYIHDNPTIDICLDNFEHLLSSTTQKAAGIDKHRRHLFIIRISTILDIPCQIILSKPQHTTQKILGIDHVFGTSKVDCTKP